MKALDVESKAVEIVAAHFKRKPGEIGRETRLREDLGGDSLDLVELIYEFEQAFDIVIPDDGAVEIRTLGDAIDHVAREVPR